MRYLAMIWTEWFEGQEVDPQEAMRYREFATEAERAGVLAGGESLQHSSTSTTVRLRDDQLLLTDGPFAETKEQINGYFVLDCADLDQAIAWARRIPGARHGAIELRPLLDMDTLMR
jgi:hypothetical protein